jgi:hypothetical protein
MEVKCKKCSLIKAIDEFYKDSRVKAGHYSVCKKCHLLYSKGKHYNVTNNNISPKQLIARRWQAIKFRHKYKGYEKVKCLITKEQFLEKMFNQEFLEMFLVWEKNGKALRFAPSVDRIDSSGHYELGNIRWLHFKDNAALGGNKPNRAKKIEQYTKDGVYIKTHQSASHACREMRGTTKGTGNIRRAALGKIPSAYGYFWK